MSTHFEKRKKNKLDNLWFLFWAFLGSILGFILGPDRPKRGQDEPKRAIRISKSQKAAFSKSLKNPQFFSVFGSRGFPRKPQEAREGSQKTPKELQRWSKTWSKSGQKVNPKTSKKSDFQASKNRSDRLKLGTFLRPWGFLKSLTSKMSKNCSRCLKTVPKWFKNGSRLPKLFKIAPKIRPYKDS